MNDEELKNIRAELAKRVGVRTQSLTIGDGIAAAANEGHIVDVRFQNSAFGAPETWTVKFHRTADVPMTVSYHGETWEEPFAYCFRQIDQIRIDTASERANR
jgi:hypothetical protein